MKVFSGAWPGVHALSAGLLLMQAVFAPSSEAAERRYLIDLGAETAPTPGWNNVHIGQTGRTLTGLVDSTGQASGLTFQITDGFWQGWIGAYNGTGTTSSSLYPATATQDSFFIGYHEGSLDASAGLRFSGLSPTGSYTFRFFASRMTDDLTTDRISVFSLGEQTVELQARNNVNNVAEFSNVSASNGVVDISLTVKPGSTYAYLGVIEIIENAGEVVNRPPVPDAGSDKVIPLPSNTVVLYPSGSDPDGDAISFHWSQVSGPSVARLHQTAWTPLVAGNLVEGTYVFRLTATDARGASAHDDVQVTVAPSTGNGSPFSRTITQKSVSANNKVIHYYESLPRGYNTDPNRQWPLIIFHHGIGERGSTEESLAVLLSTDFPLKADVPLEFVNNGVTESFIVMMPQLHGSYSNWEDFFTQAMIDTAKAELRVDPDRIYLVGYSLGGFHTWSFPQRSNANASQIAAIAPIAGGRTVVSGGVSQICRLATQNVPVWAFHAVNDGTVSVGTTDAAVSALEACVPAPNPAPRYTRYTSGNHWILGWATTPSAPAESNLFHWMLQQRRNAAPPSLSPAERTLTPRTISVPKMYNRTIGYYESLPRGYDSDANREWPLLIFLHGIGERGNGTTELSRVLGAGLPAEINAGAPLEYTVNGVNDSFVVLMPQLPSSEANWHPYYVERMIDHAVANFRIDPRRIYITGLSLGAFGTTGFVELSLANAQRIAAIAPTDGAHSGNVIWTPDLGNVSTNACNIVNGNVKVWLFYGANDSSWGWSAVEFVDRLNACSPPPGLAPLVTVYSGVGHAAYHRAYKTDHTWHAPNLYEWLLAQQRPE